jgi:L-lactate dehydrogenase complex protein LldG
MLRMTATEVDLIETFAMRAARVGVRTRRASEAEVPAVVLEIAASVDAESLAVAGSVPRREAIVAAARERGVRLAEPAELTPLERVDVGVSVARMAVAESGSLVAHSSSEDRRVELCADIHVVLVDEANVAASLDEGLALVGRIAAEGPSYVSLISGPSRSADIEFTLAVGVHGPRELHAVMVSPA